MPGESPLISATTFTPSPDFVNVMVPVTLLFEAEERTATAFSTSSAARADGSVAQAATATRERREILFMGDDTPAVGAK